MSKTFKTDLTGQKFNYLTIIEFHPTEKGESRWRCKCDCGVVWNNDLATYKLDGFDEGYTIQDAEIEWEVIGNKFDNPELLRTPKNDEVME